VVCLALVVEYWAARLEVLKIELGADDPSFPP